MKVIFLSQDMELAERISSILSIKKVIVDVVSTSEILKNYLEISSYDLIVLDTFTPNLDALALCYELQSSGHPALLLLLFETLDLSLELLGLNSGADDCLLRSVGREELVAHVWALWRRKGEKYPIIGRWGDFQVDCGAQEVSYGGQIIPLTAKEYQMLNVFLAAPRQTFSPQIIIDRAWSATLEQPSLETVKTHIRSLRIKLKKVGIEGLIQTVYGFGYRLNQELITAMKSEQLSCHGDG